MLIKGAFTNQFFFISLCTLCLIVLGEFVVAQKECINSARGQLYEDTNKNEVFEPDEQLVSDVTISIHARSTGKSIIYESVGGTFSTGDIPCDGYDVMYNNIQIGYFEISEVVSLQVHSFPIRPEVVPQSTAVPKNYRVYLPLVQR